MPRQPSKLTKFFNALFRGDRRKNADGSYTTKFGHRLIPFKVWRTNSSIKCNIDRFLTQPRAKAIYRMLEPFNKSALADVVVLDAKNDELYLESNPSAKLGKVDPRLEGRLVKDIVEHLTILKQARHNPKQHFPFF